MTTQLEPPLPPVPPVLVLVLLELLVLLFVDPERTLLRLPFLRRRPATDVTGARNNTEPAPASTPNITVRREAATLEVLHDSTKLLTYFASDTRQVVSSFAEAIKRRHERGLKISRRV